LPSDGRFPGPGIVEITSILPIDSKEYPQKFSSWFGDLRNISKGNYARLASEPSGNVESGR
jgi:hypothetical protein